MMEKDSNKKEQSNDYSKKQITLRLSENLFGKLKHEANRKNIPMQDLVTTILWNHYFENKKGD